MEKIIFLVPRIFSVNDFRNRYNAFKYAKEHGENVTFDPKSSVTSQKFKSGKVKAKVKKEIKPIFEQGTSTPI